MDIIHRGLTTFPLSLLVDNKPLMSAVATVQVHWTLPFCIALCSVELFGRSAVRDELGVYLTMMMTKDKKHFRVRKDRGYTA